MTKLLLGLLTLYLLVVVVVWLLQSKLVFPGAGVGRGVAVQAPPGVTVATRVLQNGKRIRTATAMPQGAPGAVVLFFLGNFEDLRSGVNWADTFAKFGVAAVVQEYPGYGDSEGEPSVASFLAAAEDGAKLAKDMARGLGVPMVAGGSSLGTFSAVHVAARGDVERLLLFAPPGSLEEVAKLRYWFLPVSLLLTHRFDSFAEAKDVRAQVLVLHGDRDEVVPMAQGKRLSEALNGEFLTAKGFGHNDLFYAFTGQFRDRVREFLVRR